MIQLTPEDRSSKLPALALLCGMGYRYLSPEQADGLRGAAGGKSASVVLVPVLRRYLGGRSFQVGETSFYLSPANVEKIIAALRPPLRDGLLPTNEHIYDLLRHGITVTEEIGGKSTDCTISVLDWDCPENNVFHVTEELAVADTSGLHKVVPDIVCYVNGLPLAVVECKRPDLPGNDGKPPYTQAISQMIRNQGRDYIPHLFIYTQIALAVDGMDGKYGTCGTPAKFWATWREEETPDASISAWKQGASAEDAAAILALRPAAQGDAWHVAQHGVLTGQDRCVAGLLHPARLLDGMRFFTLFEAGRDGLHRLAARYQQVFGLRAMLERLKGCEGGKRRGGVIWHTTGSGKSYTMVMLAQALVLLPELKQCRIVVVTDRVDLEKQILKNFLKSGVLGKKEAAEARVRTGRKLAEKLGKGQERILFTIIDKFHTAAQRKECRNESPDIIVLVDEGHRSQSGETHQLMRRALPNAAFIAFTGTPLLEKERSRTEETFGRILHAYTMQQAVADGTVTPLLYEERVPDLSVNEEAIDAWFDRITSGLTDQQRADLKRKFSRSSQIDRTKGRMELIAADIAAHLLTLPKGMKGQLACSSKGAAVAYQQIFEDQGLISSAVVISPPDTREGHEEVDAESRDAVAAWWSKHVGKEAESKYTQRVLDRFATEGDPQLLIVVSKLLTGFDEPRNMVLYIDKPLKQHELLQAIARVNRLHELKKFGYLVDYKGILSALDTSIASYNGLAERVQGYRAEDVQGLYAAMSTEYKRLPQLLETLDGLFTGLNLADVQALVQHLGPRMEWQDGKAVDRNRKRRDDFYLALRAFESCLGVALQSRSFYEDLSFTDADRERFKQAARRYASVRKQVRALAQETVDYDAYAASIHALLDRHIAGVAIQEPEGIYRVDDLGKGDPAQWSEDKARSEAAAIASRLTRTIDVKLADDHYPHAYFSEFLKQTIAKSKESFDAPIKQYLLFADLEKKVQAGKTPGVPSALETHPDARIWFGILRMALGERIPDGEAVDDEPTLAPWVHLALAMEDITIRAQKEFSLNMEDREKAISKGLLTLFFSEAAPETLRTDMAAIQAIIEAVTASLRVRAQKA